MSDERYELPEGWAWAPLRKVAVLNMGQSPKGVFTNDMGEGLPLIGGASDIEDGEPKPTRYTSRPTKVCRPGDIIVCVRATIGKLAKADREYCLGRGVAAIESDSIDGNFLRLYLGACVKQLSDLGTGSTFKQISKDDLHAFPIPFAPLPEQRRVVAKIEALFEQSRTARQALDRIPPLLDKFRQSVLAAAFRGDLTRDWREQHADVEPASALMERIRTKRRHQWEEALRAKGKDPRKMKYEEPKPVDTRDLPELPEEWVWARFGEAVSSMKNGIYKPADVYGDGVPCLRMYNIESGRIVWKDIKLMRLGTAEVDEYRLLPDDILLNRVNSRELVGKAAVIPQGLGDLVFESKNIRVRVRSGIVEPHYLSYYLLTTQCRKQIELGCKQTVGMATVSQSDIASWLFPFAPFEEQRCIVTKIEAVFAQADAIEVAMEAARRRADKVDQSILARAFCGALVPQDPTDEPASVLLDRVRNERRG